MAKKTDNTPIEVSAFAHQDAKRKNIPTQEMQPIMTDKAKQAVRVSYERRNPDLDPQLIWRGKYDGDEELSVLAPPLFVQEKVKPQVLIDDLRNQSKKNVPEEAQLDLFADFNGLPNEDAKTEFYQHDCNWQNRMILGDSLSVMASLAAKEGMQGQVQCIYIDPPYGIKFNSNFQWSTTTTDVKDGKDITREPEMVKAFRDTWKDGIHTYLSYLRDRIVIARDLLSDTGSIFVQIGSENVHRVRVLLDEIFGEENFVSMIFVQTTTGAGSPSKLLAPPDVGNYVLWYAKRGKEGMKYREIFRPKVFGAEGASAYKKLEDSNGNRYSIAQWEKKNGIEYSPEKQTEYRLYGLDNMTSQAGGENARPPIFLFGQKHTITKGSWKTSVTGIERLKKANRLDVSGNNKIGYVRYFLDFPAMPIPNVWNDTVGQNQFGGDKIYIVQTGLTVLQRCILMTTDPGDLVLDPTCGSGTTAYVAEQLGRRWITIDTSRVALALARARIMGARYPYYLLADSYDGQQKEAQITRTAPKTTPTSGNIRKGFVYERVPHITLKSIANNSEIDVIYEKFQSEMVPILEKFNQSTGNCFEEWEMPFSIDESWSIISKDLHKKWWILRKERQKEIDASIAAKAECEFLFDRPYVDNKKVRVAGPFTVESLSPHRYIPVDENDNPICQDNSNDDDSSKFVNMILETLKVSGVQQAHKDDKINFLSVSPWPGSYICAEGRYEEGETERRAAIFIGPEFGSVSRADLVEAVREAGEAGFDVLISCAFNYDAASAEFNKLGKIPVLKAHMNADLHMAGELKNTGSGNLFVIFGEPDIEIIECADNKIQVKLRGVDVFHPNTGEVESSEPDEIACWFIDTDYDSESFFVRHAYFLGANDPYEALKKSLNTEINQDAWESLHSDLSRPFDKPESGRIAVKVINHLGDEVLKIFRIQ